MNGDVLFSKFLFVDFINPAVVVARVPQLNVNNGQGALDDLW